jgi:hypothetical protein
MEEVTLLDSGQRERNYLHQRCCEPTGGHCRESLTPAQARRIHKKENKAKGDAPRSRKQRWLNKLRTAIEEKRKSLPEDYKSRLKDETNLIEDKGLSDYSLLPEGKPLCPKCEPVAPDWACRTKSGKKTRDHAGRTR